MGLYIAWAASSVKVPSKMRKMRRFTSCAKDHPGLWIPLIHSAVSNYTGSGQWRHCKNVSQITVIFKLCLIGYNSKSSWSVLFINVTEFQTVWRTTLSCYVRKRTFGLVRPAKIQISLRIRAVWSESSLGAFWIAEDAKCLHVNNEDSDQTAQMRRLIWVFVGRALQKVRFITLRFVYRNTRCHGIKRDNIYI